MKTLFAPLLFLSALLVLTGGCSSEYEIERFDYKAEYDRVSKTPVPASSISVEKDITEIIKRRSTYIYSAVGKRDPFRSYFGDMKAVEQDREPVSELQRYDISDLNVTAIIWGITEPRAVVVTPERKSIIVKRGSFVGKNWGKINAILQDKIEIVEVYKDPLGRKILNKLYLELPIKTVLSEGRENEQEIRDIESEESEEQKDGVKQKEKE
ncbi:MAG TPA: pilus assembly protein PilP [bacterium]|nr:pilus assembly protein PilP [bacterium]